MVSCLQLSFFSVWMNDNQGHLATWEQIWKEILPYRLQVEGSWDSPTVSVSSSFLGKLVFLRFGTQIWGNNPRTYLEQAEHTAKTRNTANLNPSASLSCDEFHLEDPHSDTWSCNCFHSKICVHKQSGAGNPSSPWVSFTSWIRYSRGKVLLSQMSRVILPGQLDNRGQAMRSPRLLWELSLSVT